MPKAKSPNQYSMQISGLFSVKEAKYKRAKTPSDILEICKDMADKGQEIFCVLTLNAKNNVIDRHMISIGILDASLVHPREVFRNAIEDGAAAIICVHNHPSGDTSPSSDDIKITKQLVEAGRVLDIRVLDHCIIGRFDGEECVLSIREEGIVKF